MSGMISRTPGQGSAGNETIPDDQTLAGRRRDWAIVIAGTVLTVLILVPFLRTPVPAMLTPDDGRILRSVARANAGLGLTQTVGLDIAQSTSESLLWWPPGAAWSLLAATSLGISLGFSFKMLYVLFVILGALGWGLVAKRYLSGFGLLLVLCAYACGSHGVFLMNKLSHVQLLAFSAFYFFWFVRAYEKQESWRPSVYAGLAAALGVLCWFGTVSLAGTGGLGVLIFHRTPLKRRLTNACLVGVPGVLVLGALIAVGYGVDATNFADSVPPNYAWSDALPLSHFVVPLNAFGAQLLGLWPIAEKVLRGAGMAGLAPGVQVGTSVALVLVVIAVYRKLGAAAPLRTLIQFTVLHFLALVSFLALLSIRMPIFLLEGVVSQISCPRYLQHVLPLVSVLWVALIATWFERTSSRQFRPRWVHRSAMVVFALCTLSIPYIPLRAIRWRKADAGIATAVVETANYLRESVRRGELKRHMIFDVRVFPYVWDGTLHGKRYSEQDADSLFASRDVYVFVVVRSGLKTSAFIDPDKLKRQGKELVSKFGLKKTRTFGRQQIAMTVYEGWVRPFEALK